MDTVCKFNFERTKKEGKFQKESKLIFRFLDPFMALRSPALLTEMYPNTKKPIIGFEGPFHSSFHFNTSD